MDQLQDRGIKVHKNALKERRKKLNSNDFRVRRVFENTFFILQYFLVDIIYLISTHQKFNYFVSKIKFTYDIEIN